MDGMHLMQDLLTGFGKTIGADEMPVDQDGYACFTVDDTMIVHLKYEAELEALRFFAELAEVPPTDKNAVMRDLLDANVLWRGSGGATLGLDSEKNVVTMAYQEPIGQMSLARFEQVLEAFIVTAEKWIERIGGGVGDKDKARSFENMQWGLRV